MADAYDLLPYTEHAYAETHPDRLRVLAALSGFPVTSSLTPRVLELGCGRGGNLLPMAASWPEATFVGVDRAASQLRDARQVAEACALANVRFVSADFTDPSALAGETFDFVLCHGVYSWIPEASRHALLGRIRAVLAPHGIAYVSFNTLPGWYRRLAARDFLRFAARTSLADGPRDALRWLGRAVTADHATYRDDLLAVHARLVATESAYLTHEYLADEHHPLLAGTFIEEAVANGLAYLGDAVPSEVATELLPEEVQSRTKGMPLGDALTLADFARDTAFRRALLVRADTAATLAFRAPDTLDAKTILAMRVATRLRPCGDARGSGTETFEGVGTRVVLSGLPATLVRHLAMVAPRSLPCEALAREVRAPPEEVARELFDLWLANAGIDLSYREPDVVTTVSPRPRALPVARWHARVGGPVTNAWHQEVALEDDVVRLVLGRLDGETSTESLAKSLQEMARPGESVSLQDAGAVVLASLHTLARGGLLVG